MAEKRIMPTGPAGGEKTLQQEHERLAKHDHHKDLVDLAHPQWGEE